MRRDDANGGVVEGPRFVEGPKKTLIGTWTVSIHSVGRVGALGNRKSETTAKQPEDRCP